MMKEIDTKQTHGFNGNYSIYVRLEDNALLDIILLSSLDDTINHVGVTDHNMPEACKNIFGNVQFLYEYFEHYIANSERVYVSDIGSISIVEIMDRKGKPVKLECQLSTNKIIDPIQLNTFYLKIIHQFISHQQANKQIISSCNEKCESKMIPQEPNKTQISSSNLSKSKCQRLLLTVDITQNMDYEYFQKIQDTIKIVDYSKKRLNLFFRQVIPNGSIVYFSIKVINLKMNTISVGLYDKNQVKYAKRSEYNYCFDFGKSKIKDSSNRKDQPKTQWRRLKNIVPSDFSNALLRTEVNLKEGRLCFYCNGVLLVQTLINNYMMSKELVPYINCKYMGDEFKINVE